LKLKAGLRLHSSRASYHPDNWPWGQPTTRFGSAGFDYRKFSAQGAAGQLTREAEGQHLYQKIESQWQFWMIIIEILKVILTWPILAVNDFKPLVLVSYTAPSRNNSGNLPIITIASFILRVFQA
jgi:hypothetical protein